MDGPMDVGAGSAEEAAATAAEATREESQEGRIEGGDADEALLGRAQRLVSKIMDARANPNPRHIHALAAMLESQETRLLLPRPFVDGAFSVCCHEDNRSRMFPAIGVLSVLYRLFFSIFFRFVCCCCCCIGVVDSVVLL